MGGNGSNRGVFWTEGRVEIGLKYLKFSLRLLSHFVGVKDVVIGWVIGFVQAVRSRVIKRR